MNLPNNSISLPSEIWSSRTQTLQSLSDDQLSAIREQSRASLHNTAQQHSLVTINGREYSVTYHPQDSHFSVQRINGFQGRFAQWFYRITGHPLGQITQQLTSQLNSPNNQRNYRVTGAALLPAGVSVSTNNRPTVSAGKIPPPVPPKPFAPPSPPKFHSPTAPVFVNNRQPVSGKIPPPVPPKPFAPPSPPKFHSPTAPVFVNNRQPVSTGKISAPDAPKPSSPDSWATKLKDAVLRQQAGGTLTTKEKDFSGANLSDINLNDYLPPNFKAANNQITISGFDFSNANLSLTDFSDINFEKCKFTNSNIFNAILKNTRFSNLDLGDTNREIEINYSNSFSFSKVTLKNAIVKPGVNLSGVISHEPDNTPPKPGHGYDIRLGDFWLATPLFWDERYLDMYLNHENNEGRSMLTTIDSLSDKYINEKVQAMEGVVKSLESGRYLREAELRPVVSSLVSILDRHPYTQSALIRDWLGPVQTSFLAHHCKFYNEAPLPVPDKYFQQYTLPALLNSFEKDNAAMTTHSAFFNQVILHSMTGTDCTDDTRQKATALYEQYLAHPAMSPHVNNGLFGNYDGRPDWTSQDADNFLLVSSRAPDTAMMLSANTLLTMLNPTPETAWDHFYLLKGGENIPSSQISPGELFRHDFKVFFPVYNKEAQKRNFGKLIDTILSPREHSELNQQFIEATNQKHSTVKFVDDASVSRLNAVFEPLLPEGKLSPAHYQHILSAYYLTGASPQEQAKTLFCLSTTFARYSSSAIFGTEHDSPPILRGYAEALMQKAWELSPKIFPSRKQFTDWSNRLHGLHGVFTCSSVVAGAMQTHAREHFPDVLSSIRPLAWG